MGPGGLILVRDLDERLGVGDLVAQHLSDSRRGKTPSFQLRQFQVFTYPEEPELAPSWAAGVARDGKD